MKTKTSSIQIVRLPRRSLSLVLREGDSGTGCNDTTHQTQIYICLMFIYVAGWSRLYWLKNLRGGERREKSGL